MQQFMVELANGSSSHSFGRQAKRDASGVGFLCANLWSAKLVWVGLTPTPWRRGRCLRLRHSPASRAPDCGFFAGDNVRTALWRPNASRVGIPNAGMSPRRAESSQTPLPHKKGQAGRHRCILWSRRVLALCREIGGPGIGPQREGSVGQFDRSSSRSWSIR
jgi:hypothetical protein